uniref:sushi, von Willebrand factor type A, EGF and pentraxin domain-containing protein 1-like isoform X2 n=1 Tax=Ciona intestinalis TaxID=7719 RepID=UPI000EF4AA82|nr:sushi, von Willebrand factor type A, EGF and pentraxin domain-containing protein 1-like isoform X2 [Ciona intestinalis]|eukprot:XP_026689849.1 sushi, von Willebrand factor type A, EGF and pentraxin domain-containing protein 1-like isoform X2 [Ciona intestinalis]
MSNMLYFLCFLTLAFVVDQASSQNVGATPVSSICWYAYRLGAFGWRPRCQYPDQAKYHVEQCLRYIQCWCVDPETGTSTSTSYHYRGTRSCSTGSQTLCPIPTNQYAWLCRDCTISCDEKDTRPQCSGICRLGCTCPQENTFVLGSRCVQASECSTTQSKYLTADCPNPPAIGPNGSFPPAAPYTNSEQVTYTCNTGYTLSGTNPITCNAGTWLPNQAPTCTAVAANCPNPPPIGPNGSFPPAAPYTNLEQVTYSCNTGYTLSGTNPITCNAGTWLPNQAPTCTAVPSNCPNPPSIGPNGSFPPAAPYTNFEQVTYTCNTGYTLSGTNPISCIAGSWVPSEAPTCTSTSGCGFGQEFSYCSQFSCQETCRTTNFNPCPRNHFCIPGCVCRRGYAGHNGGCILKSQCPTPAPPTAVCPVASNAYRFWCRGCTISCAEKDYKRQCPRYCRLGCICPEPGTFVLGNRCVQENECSSAQNCPNPPAIGPNGSFPPAAPYTNLEQVTYSCNTGYTLSGTNPITCNAGTWLPNQAPTCTAVPPANCPNPPAIGPNGSFPPAAPYINLEQVTYSCNTGYTLSGTNPITCNAGTWLPNQAPTCTAVPPANCPNPPAIGPNGSFPPAAPYINSEQVTYSCNTGYTLSGTNPITCNAGTWIPNQAPTCTAVQSIDLLFIMEGNDNVETSSCSQKESQLSTLRPFGPGGILTSANFPNFFQQQQFLLSFYLNLASTNPGTKVALQMHEGLCTVSPNGAAASSKKTFISTQSLLTVFSGVQYKCGTPRPISVLRCASAFHFTAANGDRPTVPNAIILVVPDITVATGYNSAVIRNAYLTGLGNVRNTLGADVFTVSLLPTSSANYAANSAYLQQLACGSGVNCGRFLGSIFDPTFALNTFKLKYP